MSLAKNNPCLPVIWIVFRTDREWPHVPHDQRNVQAHQGTETFISVSYILYAQTGIESWSKTEFIYLSIIDIIYDRSYQIIEKKIHEH